MFEDTFQFNEIAVFIDNDHMTDPTEIYGVGVTNDHMTAGVFIDNDHFTDPTEEYGIGVTNDHMTDDFLF